MRAGWAVLILTLLPGALSQSDVAVTIDPPEPVAGSPTTLEVVFPGEGEGRQVQIVEAAEDAELTAGTVDLHVHLPSKGAAVLHVRVPGATAVEHVEGALANGARLIAGNATALGSGGTFHVPVFFPFAGAWNVSVATDVGRREAAISVPESPGLVATVTGSEASTLVALRQTPARFHVGEEMLAVVVYETRDFVTYARLDGVQAVASATEAATGARVQDTPLRASGEGQIEGRFRIPFPGTWEIRVNVTHPDYPVARILSAGPVSRLPVEAVFTPVDARSLRSAAMLSQGSYALLAHGPGEDATWRFSVAPAPRPFVAISGSARASPGVPMELALFVARPDGEPMAGARDLAAVLRNAAGAEIATAVLAPEGAAYLWRGLVLPAKGGYAVHVSSESLGLSPGDVAAARLEAGPPPDSIERDPPPVPGDPGWNPVFVVVGTVFLAGILGLAVATLRKR